MNYKLIVIGVFAAALSFIPGYGVFHILYINPLIWFGTLFSWRAVFAASMFTGIVCGAVIGTGASFLASSILGVDVTSMLLKYVPICVSVGSVGPLLPFF